MKKAKYFMLSYICVLLISTVIMSVTKSSFINNLACASTLSGYLFAFADIYLNYAFESQKIIDNSKKQMKTFNQKTKEVFEKYDIFIKRYKEKIEEYDKNGWENKNKMEYYNILKTLEKITLKLRKKIFDKSGNVIDIEYKYMNACKKGSDFLFICACMIFFFTIFFPPIVIYMEDSQNIITINGWVIVMLNYYLSCESEEKVRNQIKNRKQNIEKAISIFENAIQKIEM